MKKQIIPFCFYALSAVVACFAVYLSSYPLAGFAVAMAFVSGWGVD